MLLPSTIKITYLWKWAHSSFVFGEFNGMSRNQNEEVAGYAPQSTNKLHFFAFDGCKEIESLFVGWLLRFHFSNYLLFWGRTAGPQKEELLNGLAALRSSLVNRSIHSNSIRFLYFMLKWKGRSSWMKSILSLFFLHFHSFVCFLSSFSLCGGAIAGRPAITHQRKEKTKQAGLPRSININQLSFQKMKELIWWIGSLPHQPSLFIPQKDKSFYSILNTAGPPKQLNHQTNHSSHSQREEWMFDWLLLRRD